MTDRKKASDFPKEILALFDGYVHGFIHRRDFLEGAARLLGGGGPGLGGLQVIHESRGLNPYIEDVVRRSAAADFVALGPDALTPVGGYPGNDDEGRAMQQRLDRDVMMQDWMAAFRFLRDHESTTGRIGAVGFCYGGGVVNLLAARLPDLGAGVPFYGSAPPLEAVPNIRAPLMIQYAGLDERVNAAWPDYQRALDEHGKAYTMHMYEGANHGFHNDTTPRFDPEAARLAQERTIAFFNEHLRG